MRQAIADPRLQRIVARFERLSPDDLPGLGTLYRDNARFKDPFNEVQGLQAIQGIFAHMFESLDGPRFVIRDAIAQGPQCFVTWDFVFRMKRFSRDEQCIRGASHLVLAEDGRIQDHRDYWDAAEELYEKLPVVGALMRWLKRRAAS
jgi:ketosteroid isomerase-like protein